MPIFTNTRETDAPVIFLIENNIVSIKYTTKFLSHTPHPTPTSH